ncbi:MAG: PilZ domain-containing protein [Hyphomicrobiaceae bacterium]
MRDEDIVERDVSYKVLNGAFAERELQQRAGTPVEALVNELENAGIHICLTTSILNALISGEDGGLGRTACAHLPPDPVVFPAAEMRLIGCEATWLAVQALRHLYEHLGLAKAALGGMRLEAGEDFGSALRRDRNIVVRWRTVAHSGVLAIDEVRSVLGDILPATTVHRLESLCNFLGAVEGGESPCVVEGRAEMPRWAQRRRHRRFLANIRGHARCKGTRESILVTDVSQGGLAMNCSGAFKEGDLVGVTLATGRRLFGTIVWVKGERCGVRFSRELPANDPLLAAG